MSVLDLPKSVVVDPERGTATVSAGLSYGAVAGQLHAQGWALPNLGSLPQISVAGACATGTHGSGRRLGCLASSVSGLDFVRADGELATLSRHDADFSGAVVALGSLGVVTAVTLDVVPTFDVRQVVYNGLTRAAVAERFDEVHGQRLQRQHLHRLAERDDARMAQGPGRLGRRDLAPDWLGATAATVADHPVPGVDAGNATEQLGVAGPVARAAAALPPQLHPEQR